MGWWASIFGCVELKSWVLGFPKIGALGLRAFIGRFIKRVWGIIFMAMAVNYPTLKEIVEINTRLGEGGVLVNRGNLEFVLDKARATKGFARKARVFLLILLDCIRSWMAIRGQPFIQCCSFWKSTGEHSSMGTGTRGRLRKC